MKFGKRTKASVLGLLLVTGVAAAALTQVNPANAATISTSGTIANSCSGFSYERSANVPTGASNSNRWGHVDIYWSNNGQRNCVVLNKDKYVGTSSHIELIVTGSSGQRSIDNGNYGKYAGAAIVKSPSCLQVQAYMSVPNKKINPNDPTAGDAYYYSGYIMC